MRKQPPAFVFMKTESLNMEVGKLLGTGLPLMSPQPGGMNPVQPKHFVLPQMGEEIEHRGHFYRIGKQLSATGHFGVVFECTDSWGNELVAKILLPKARTYEAVRDDWLRELNNLIDLRNPFITHVFDAFEYQDTFYLIIERCSFSLADLIAWPDTQGEVWLNPIARCVLQAIHFIHSVGYVHKDIHPGNILTRCVKGEMGESNTVMTFKVSDLGISRLEPQIRPGNNTILAKWIAPPEFLNPTEFGTVSRTVDIYHAGLVFLSLLLNRVPTFTEQEVLAGIPRQMAESLSSPYAPAVAKALRRHTRDRTQTAQDFWYDLKMAEAGKMP